MDSLVPAPRAPVHRSFLRFIHDRNPFYLLSALSMFVGFRVVLGALDSAPGDWKTLLRLIVTLNAYEAVMIALALFLIKSRGMLRDGWILLGIEALFLVDLTNLNAELFTAMPRLGLVVNGACFVLALVKVLIVVRTLKLRLHIGTALYIAAQMAMLLGLPGIFRVMRSPAGAVTPMQIYAVWWAVGLLFAGGVFLVKRAKASDDSPMAALPFRLYAVMPLVSLLVHLCSENRVYWVHFQPANVAPVLLAAVVLLNRSTLRWHPMALRWSMALLLAAVALSVMPHEHQQATTAHLLGMNVSPLRLMLLAGAGVMVWMSALHRSQLAGCASAGMLLLATQGTHVPQMRERALGEARYSYGLARQLVPENAMQWGYVAIGAAFVLLAVGALVSLRRPPSAVVSEPMEV